MDEPKQPPSLNEIEQRLRAAQAREHQASGSQRVRREGGSSGMGLAARITVELVVSVLVGGGIGYALDQWLGSTPWLMLVFLMLGGAAGVMTAYRAVKGLDESVGLGGAIERQSQADRPDDDAT